MYKGLLRRRTAIHCTDSTGPTAKTGTLQVPSYDAYMYTYFVGNFTSRQISLLLILLVKSTINTHICIRAQWPMTGIVVDTFGNTISLLLPKVS